MAFKFSRLEIPEVIFVVPSLFKDDRGYFLESYKQSEFAANDITDDFIQDNFSSSIKGVLRGLHYQLDPKAQGKLVSCVSGEIFDIAVDIRKSSATFGRWVFARLTGTGREMLYIPAGFAHGFYALSEAMVAYKTTNEYSPAHDRGIIWNDPHIAIEWPAGLKLLSDKDNKLPQLKDAEVFK